MLDRLLSVFTGHQTPAHNPAHAERRSVLRMVGNDRMAGSIPMWKPAESAQEEIENDLSLAQNSVNGASPFAQGLKESSNIIPTTNDEEFGFADLIDIVNPLQHIPVVNHLYRSITGDQIKPVTQILGGGVFAGPVGLAGGLVNFIVEKETGKDITGNALAFITNGEAPRLIHKDTPELPGTALAFADLTYSEPGESNVPVINHKPRVWAGND